MARWEESLTSRKYNHGLTSVEFTRLPIIESIITPKEGYKLVIRNSKISEQEEFSVEAVEVVSIGRATFFRSTEKPRSFLVPVTDYEVIEVREGRLSLKGASIEKGVKNSSKVPKEHIVERAEKAEPSSVTAVEADSPMPALPSGESQQTDARGDRRRDKRRNGRKRRGREDGFSEEGEAAVEQSGKKAPPVKRQVANEVTSQEKTVPPLSSLLLPPPTLISETIARYRDNALFSQAFYTKEEQQNQAAQRMRSEQQSTEGSPLESEARSETEAPLAESPEDLLEALDMRNFSLDTLPFGTFDEEVAPPMFLGLEESKEPPLPPEE